MLSFGSLKYDAAQVRRQAGDSTVASLADTVALLCRMCEELERDVRRARKDAASAKAALAQIKRDKK